MQRKETQERARPRPQRARHANAIYAKARGHLLELTFSAGYRRRDVEVVKAIPGRRWLPNRRVWLVPNTRQSLEALTGAFASRLVLDNATKARRTPASSAQGGDAEPVKDPPSASSEAALLEAMKLEITTRDYSPRTEHAYLGWVRRFLRFRARSADSQEPLDGSHARTFLEHLATTERLSAKSRNQAASALAFLFRDILGRDDISEIPRAKGPRRLPTVLSHHQVLRVLRELSGKYLLIVVLLYSAGLRLEECLRLRVKDVDFELRQILVRDGKGQKDRYVPLATRAVGLLRAQIRRVAELHQADLESNQGWAPLPRALHRKDPTAGEQITWQFVFPSRTVTADPSTGREGRRPLHPSAVQRQVKRAVRRSGIPKRASCHTFRHSFATEALRGGCDVRTLQNVMGHKDIRTTMIYLHAVEQSGLHMRSPLDRPDDPEEDDWHLATRPK